VKPVGGRVGARLWLAALLFLVACGPAYRGEPIYGPLDASDPQVALGQQVFAINCNQCHPGGNAGVGLAINNKALPGWFIEFQVRNGVGVMPSFTREQISDAELDAVVEYLVALRRLEVVEAKR
jgi:mono/diheme cytochrome c family protein